MCQKTYTSDFGFANHMKAIHNQGKPKGINTNAARARDSTQQIYKHTISKKQTILSNHEYFKT